MFFILLKISAFYFSIFYYYYNRYIERLLVYEFTLFCVSIICSLLLYWEWLFLILSSFLERF